MTVSQLNNYVKELLEDDPSLAYAEVEGEISNFKHYLSSGHMYFTLKDDDAAIGAVMYKGAAVNLSFLPKDGTKVKVKGTVSIYPQTGKYQIIVREMQRSGEGDLYFAYEMLKKRLYSEGLFNEDRKKSIPKFPKKVGIITSKFGAALQDILSISKRRYPLAEIIVYPSLVQGQGAAESMLCGLSYFNDSKSKVDVIILGRGGGSIEDLWAFNDEQLARAVYASDIPIISAVGHETDFTICDFVADLRAPTPSAAAELAFPDMQDIKHQLCEIRYSLSEIMEDKMCEAEEMLSLFSSDKVISLLESKYNSSQEKITDISSTLRKNMINILRSSEQTLLLSSELLDANSPHRILSKGYSILTNSKGNIVHQVDQVNINDKLNIRVSDGSIVTEITAINKQSPSDNQ